MDRAEIKTRTEWFYLALCIWREARGQNRDARVAVGWVVLNRVARPSWWGRTVDEVVTKKWQFSSLTDPHDPQLTTWPTVADPSWQACCDVADDVLSNRVQTTTAGADSYFDISIGAPDWTKRARLCGQIGRLIFYDTDHDYEAVAIEHTA